MLGLVKAFRYIFLLSFLCAGLLNVLNIPESRAGEEDPPPITLSGTEPDLGRVAGEEARESEIDLKLGTMQEQPGGTEAAGK